MAWAPPVFERGADLGDGQDGADGDEWVTRRQHEDIRAFDRLENAGRRPRGWRPGVVDGIDLVAVPAGDEPFLEGERAGGCLEERAHRGVGRGQELALQACQLCQPPGYRREGLTTTPELGAYEMEPEG